MIDRRTDWQKSLNAKISLTGHGFQSTDRMLLKPNPPSGIGDYARALGVELSVAEAIVQKHLDVPVYVSVKGHVGKNFMTYPLTADRTQSQETARRGKSVDRRFNIDGTRKTSRIDQINRYARTLGVEFEDAQERVKAQESRVASEPAWIEVT